MKQLVTLSERYLRNCKFVYNRYIAINQLPKNGIVAEVGVLAGDFSAWLIEHNKPKELHLIDIYDCADYAGRNRFTRKENESFIRKRFATQIENKQVFIRKGNSWSMLAKYPDHYFDWIYIDAAHDYISVVKDLEQAGKKVKSEGYLVMNDYIMYDHLAKTEYGVVQATNEFCIQHNWEFIYFAFHPNLFCDVVLRKIKE